MGRLLLVCLAAAVIVIFVIVRDDSLFLNERQSEEVPEADRKVTLRLLTEAWPTLDSAIEVFQQQHPDIRIERQAYSYEQLMEVLDLKMSSGASDLDVFVVDEPMIPAYTGRGYLLPLDSYFSDADKGQIIESSLNAGRYEGKLMAAPMNTSEQLLFYNKALLQQAGIPYPGEAPAQRLTWEQIAALARQAMDGAGTDREEPVWGLMFEQIGRPYQMLALPNSLGGQGIGADGVTVQGVINDEAWLESAQFYGDLFNKLRITPRNVKAYESRIPFISGNVAFFIGGTWNISSFAKEISAFEYGIAPHPYFAEGTPATPTGSWHLGISAHSAHPDEAAAFIRFMTIGQGADIWFQLNGDLPSKKTLFNAIRSDPEYGQFPKSGFRLAADELLHTSVPRPKTIYYWEWDKIVTAALEDIRNGGDPRAVLDEAAAQYDSLIEGWRNR